VLISAHVIKGALFDITAAFQKLVLLVFRVVLTLILNVLPHRLVNSAVGRQGQDRRSCPWLASAG
jgi:hypothetical protein